MLPEKAADAKLTEDHTSPLPSPPRGSPLSHFFTPVEFASPIFQIFDENIFVKVEEKLINDCFWLFVVSKCCRSKSDLWPTGSDHQRTRGGHDESCHQRDRGCPSICESVCLSSNQSAGLELINIFIYLQVSPLICFHWSMCFCFSRSQKWLDPSLKKWWRKEWWDTTSV